MRWALVAPSMSRAVNSPERGCRTLDHGPNVPCAPSCSGSERRSGREAQPVRGAACDELPPGDRFGFDAHEDLSRRGHPGAGTGAGRPGDRRGPPGDDDAPAGVPECRSAGPRRPRRSRRPPPRRRSRGPAPRPPRCAAGRRRRGPGRSRPAAWWAGTVGCGRRGRRTPGPSAADSRAARVRGSRRGDAGSARSGPSFARSRGHVLPPCVGRVPGHEGHGSRPERRTPRPRAAGRCGVPLLGRGSGRLRWGVDAGHRAREAA